MRQAIALIAGGLLTQACIGTPVGYRTNSAKEAIAMTAWTVANNPEMVQPRDARRQREMEREAEPQGVEVVPEGLLGPLFFVDSAAAPARYGGLREELPPPQE